MCDECTECEWYTVLFGCWCEAFCCCCCQDFDTVLNERRAKYEKRRRNASAASKTKAAVVTQPKSINATPKEPEEQPLKSTNKENIDGAVPMSSPTLELSTQSQAERIS